MSDSISAAVGQSIDRQSGPDKENDRNNHIRDLMTEHGRHVKEEKQRKWWSEQLSEHTEPFQLRLDDSRHALKAEGVYHDGITLNPYIFEVSNEEPHYTNEAA